MKNTNYKKLMLPGMHLLFWVVSFNFWHLVLNHGVDVTFEVEGIEIEWPVILATNCIFMFILSMPFIWLAKKIRRVVKIIITGLFVAIFSIVIYYSLYPTEEIDLSIFAVYFIKDFMYVVVFHFTILASVYYNLKLLVGNYLAQSRFALYFVSASGLAVVAGVLNYAIFNLVIDKLIPELFYISYFKIWELILITAGYLAFTTIIFLIWQYAEMLIIKREEARNELSALKSQINPHFLFNNLNTIYSFAEKKDERTTEMILKLSDFLRYILYDTASESIPLSKEVEIIRSYVGLQKERINQTVTRIIFTEEGEFGDTPIAPLLLLPLAENCFKHGVGNVPGTISINIRFDGKELYFKSENSIALREKSGPEENGGIGISNVEKRLNLLYPNRHSLNFQKEEGVFRLEMRIELK